MALSLKQSRFVDAYLGSANGNATQAARIVGYKCPGSMGQQLLKNYTIQLTIDQRQSSDPLILTREERQRILTKWVLDESLSLRDRAKAMDLLCKTGGDYLIRHEVTQTDVVFNVIIDSPVTRRMAEAALTVGEGVAPLTVGTQVEQLTIEVMD